MPGDYIGRRKPIMLIGTSLSVIFLSLLIYLPVLNLLLLALLLGLFGLFAGFDRLWYSFITW